MKTIQSLLFSWLLLLSFNACCQQSRAAEIKNMEAQERNAVTAGDTAVLFRLWHPDYVVNNPNNMILTAAQLKGFIRSGGIDRPSFTRTIEKISFVNNVAVIMGSELLTPKDKLDNPGKPLYRRFTNMWIRTEKSWQLCARQVTTTLIQ